MKENLRTLVKEIKQLLGFGQVYQLLQNTKNKA